jgi:DNA polymerase II small subunit/DNA polymerase delta subunit B
MSLITAAARIAINSLVGQDWGYNAITRFLVNEGLSYRRTQMLSDIREAYGHKLNQRNIMNLSGNSTIPEAWMSQKPLEYAKTYRIDFEVHGYDKKTGEPVTDYKSMFTDQYLKKENYIEGSPAYLEENQYDKDYNVSEVFVVGMVKNTRL